MSNKKSWSYTFLCLRSLKILLPYCYVTLGSRSVSSYLIRYASEHLVTSIKNHSSYLGEGTGYREWESSSPLKGTTEWFHISYTLCFLLEFIRKSKQSFFQHVSDKTKWNSKISNETDTTLNQTSP